MLVIMVFFHHMFMLHSDPLNFFFFLLILSIFAAVHTEAGESEMMDQQSDLGVPSSSTGCGQQVCLHKCVCTLSTFKAFLSFGVSPH